MPKKDYTCQATNRQ